jgi:DnaJ-class molecular chaperone
VISIKDLGLCADPLKDLCPECYGEGKLTLPFHRQPGSMEITCPPCDGTGKRDTRPATCH